MKASQLPRDFPLTVLMDDGGCVCVHPSRAIAAVATAPDWTSIWYFDAKGFVEQVHINAAVEHVRFSLGLSVGA